MKRVMPLLAVGVCLAALSVASGSAGADPSGSPTFRDLVGVGSATTQDVMNALSNAIAFDGTKVIGSYDATGTANITTKDPSVDPNCQNIPRPIGSSSGIDALLTSQTAEDGCLQFARSSINDASARPGTNLVYIPFAKDALTFATGTVTNVPKTFTVAQLTTIYTRNGTPGQPPCIRQPLLPRLGSGVRSRFLTFLGIGGPGQSALGTCVQDTLNGVPIEEDDGRVLTNPEQLVPLSVAHWIAQTTQSAVPDQHGSAVLRMVNGVAPLPLITNSIMSYDVYNVVPKGYINDQGEVQKTFVGPTSAVCTNTVAIQQQGFAPNPNCGDTSIQSSGTLTPTTSTLTYTPPPATTIKTPKKIAPAAILVNFTTVVKPAVNGAYFFFVNLNIFRSALVIDFNKAGQATAALFVNPCDVVRTVFLPAKGTLFDASLPTVTYDPNGNC